MKLIAFALLVGLGVAWMISRMWTRAIELKAERETWDDGEDLYD